MNSLVPIGDMERMALAFSKSGMFGAKTPDQALALLLLAQAEGQHPAIAMRDFDVIQGRPAKKAEAMLRSFIAAGGKVEWHQLDDSGADATFSHPQGGSARISWDSARAKKAGLSGRDMYSKYPRAMYRSRVVSEGCRTVYPAATSGLYVPEEVRQMLKEDRRPERDMGAAEVVNEEAPPPASEPDADDEALKALESDAPPITRTDTLRELCSAAMVTLPDILAKAGVRHADELTGDDYTSAVAMLRRRASKIADKVTP